MPSPRREVAATPLLPSGARSVQRIEPAQPTVIEVKDVTAFHPETSPGTKGLNWVGTCGAAVRHDRSIVTTAARVFVYATRSSPEAMPMVRLGPARRL